MEKKSGKRKIQLNKVCLMIAILHWILTFFTDRFIFQYVTWDFSNMTQTVKTAVTYGAKAVFLLVLIGIWHGLYYLAKKADRRLVFCILFYFAVNMILLIGIWPGVWRMDEFGILNSAVLLLPVFWQHCLTSVFYVISLMLIPVPTGVIIVQCACISLVAGYIVMWFVKRFGKWGYASFVPFFFLPVLDSNLYPMRMSMYAFLELWLLVLVYEKYLKIAEKNRIIDIQGYSRMLPIGNVAFCVLAAIVTLWRTESIYYVLLFPLLLWILFRKNRKRKFLIKTICIYLAVTLILFIPQKIGDKLTSGNQYDLTSVVLPLVPLTERAYADHEDLSAIDKVVSVDAILAGAKEGKNGINLFWGNPDFQREGYSNEDYARFKSAYYGLVLKYPSVFLKERWTCFWQSVDLLQNTTELFTSDGVPNYETFRKYPLTKPLNNDIRTSLISFLEWRSRADYTQKKGGYGFMYGPFWPILILLLCWAVCLIRRKRAEFFILSLPLVKLPLIFLTAPSRLFMYYYSLYLIGWVLLFYILLCVWSRVWDKIGAPVAKTLRYAKRNGVKKAFYASMERIDHKHTDALTKKAAMYKGCREWACSGEEESEDDLKSDQKDNPKKDRKDNQNDNKKNSRKDNQENNQKDRFKISIVVPTYETDSCFLTELINCVKKQTYSDWELIIADASRSDAVKKITEEEIGKTIESGQSEQSEGFIKYIRLEENKGISENTNVGIDAATGDYIALLDHDDLLTYDALEKMTECLYEIPSESRKSVLAVYSDEDKCDGTGEVFYEPNFKPDFNLDLLLSNNYICHFLMVRADIMKQLKLRAEYDGAQDYDLILRLALMTENGKNMTGSKQNQESDDGQDGRQGENGQEENRQKTGSILHAPYVLYHWRCHEESTAVNTDSKRYAYDAGREALKAFYKAVGMEESTEVTDSEHLGFYRTEYKPDIFTVRKDVAALCGRVIENHIVTASPDHLFDGLKAYSSGYLHRADLRMEVQSCDERALQLRPDLEGTLEEALKQGMKLLYDPELLIE